MTPIRKFEIKDSGFFDSEMDLAKTEPKSWEQKTRVQPFGDQCQC